MRRDCYRSVDRTGLQLQLRASQRCSWVGSGLRLNQTLKATKQSGSVRALMQPRGCDLQHLQLLRCRSTPSFYDGIQGWNAVASLVNHGKLEWCFCCVITNIVYLVLHIMGGAPPFIA